MKWTVVASVALLGCAPPASPAPADPPASSGQTNDDDDEATPPEDDSVLTTSGLMGSTGPGSTTMMLAESSSSSSGEPAIDPNLDRSAANILDQEGLCGYPGPGEFGYGGIIDQSRFPNFVLTDCAGNEREFAEFFCRRDDGYDDYNHAFVVVFEAVW